MKTKCLVLAASLSFVLAQTTRAGTIVLTFDQLGIIPASAADGGAEPILNFYAGGYAGNGTAKCGYAVCGPGPNYGISFESNAIVATTKLNGGSGNFDQEPGGAFNGIGFLVGTGDVMNVAGGFTTGFSFYYSAPLKPGSVTVWSGPDATGTELANIVLPTTPDGKTYGPPCDAKYFYCPFEPVGVTFTGTAESVDFSGTVNRIGFVDITLGSKTPGTSAPPPPPTIPEPGSLLLLGSGLAALGSRLLRSRAQISR